ncbi:hypothetical protein PoB_001913300 [Plakobranchus ocellatus]|uniref:Uncharacterized protein n=1 Tax=Plakobranchus ocellatus TaxID=259542 RepID=A0AAV3ZD30_9GAST|nr:hypothetical protein PoB_001913300 [Plakobranchus ocellatus]
MKLFSDASLDDYWPKALPGILFALCTSKHDSTKIAAFFLMYKGEPKLPVELIGQHFTTKAQADTEWAYSQQQYSSEKKTRLRPNVRIQNNSIPQTKSIKDVFD